MSDILKDIQKRLPKIINAAHFEGANIVLYTDDIEFFKDNQGKIKELVSEFKKRIELRIDPTLLRSEEETEKIIRETVPIDADVTAILFDPQRSIVVIEAKRPGLVIGKSGLILKEIKDKSYWIPQIQRSPAIRSKITENIPEDKIITNCDFCGIKSARVVNDERKNGRVMLVCCEECDKKIDISRVRSKAELKALALC